MRTGKTVQVVAFVSAITCAYCFQKTVKPVLVDTSLCADFADVLSGNREPQQENAIKFNESHNVSTNTTQCMVSYAFLDFMYPGRSTVYEQHLLRWQLSPDTARFCDRNYGKIDVTTTNFNFVKQTTESSNIVVLECRDAYCLLRVPTNGCMNSKYIGNHFSSTESVLVRWLCMIMLIRTPDTIMMQIQAIIANQHEPMTTGPHMFSKTHGMVLTFPSKCINQEQTPCTQAQAFTRAQSIISGLKSIMQTPQLFLESVHKNTKGCDLYDVNCRAFQLQPRRKNMQEYTSGFRKCPENITQTGATDTFCDENGYVYKLRCIPCRINTYYSEDRIPAPDVNKKQKMFVTSKQSNDNDLHVNMTTQVLTYFITSNSMQNTDYIEDIHSQSVVDPGAGVAECARCRSNCTGDV